MTIRKVMTTRLLALSLVVGGCFSAGFAGAQSQTLAPLQNPLKGYDSSTGYKYGLTTDYGSLVPSVKGDLLISDADFPTAATEGKVLGCSALSFNEVTKQILDGADASTFYNIYTGTQAQSVYRTTLYNNPALATEFNSLMAFASDRVKFLQSKCQATDVTGTAKDMQSQAVAQCVESVLTLNSQSYRDTNAVANAYRQCLLDPDPATNTRLVDASVDAVSSIKWTGSLHDALGRTNFCNTSYTVADTACSLLAFVPDYRWCPGTGVGLAGQCDGTSERVVDARISMRTVFDSAFYLARLIISSYLEYVDSLPFSRDELAELMQTYNFSYTTTPASTLQVTDIADEFESFANCSNQYDEDSSKFREPENMSDYLTAYSLFGSDPDLQTKVTNQLAIPTPTGVLSRASIESELAKLTVSPDWNIPLKVAILSTVAPSDFIVRSGKLDDPAAFELIPVSVFCTMKDALRLTIVDYAIIALNGDETHALTYALSSYVAQNATEQLMSFVQKKLRSAYTEMQLDDVADDRGFPAHVPKTLSLILADMEKKTQDLEALRLKRKSLADLMVEIRKPKGAE